MNLKKKQQRLTAKKKRKGAILVLAAMVLVMVFSFVAFTIDTGYMTVVKTELQATADAAAMGSISEMKDGNAAVRAMAQKIGLANTAGGKPINIDNVDIQLGIYDMNAKTFTVSVNGANAVKVIARVKNEKFFFAPIMSKKDFNMSTTAISMLNPRDIIFAIDLSGSMNDDTEPCWSTDIINSTFASQGYPTVANDLMTDIFTDFGYGTYPGTYNYLGSPLGITADKYAYAEMTKDNGVLTPSYIPSVYRINNNDSESTRKTKAYKWIIDYQIAVAMPNAKP
ncbi:hypothetical protein MNBD_PLANCTO02-1863, partial [hydrothermal vent metagenome]